MRVDGANRPSRAGTATVALMARGRGRSPLIGAHRPTATGPAGVSARIVTPALPGDARTGTEAMAPLLAAFRAGCTASLARAVQAAQRAAEAATGSPDEGSCWRELASLLARSVSPVDHEAGWEAHQRALAAQSAFVARVHAAVLRPRAKEAADLFAQLGTTSRRRKAHPQLLAAAQDELERIEDIARDRDDWDRLAGTHPWRPADEVEAFERKAATEIRVLLDSGEIAGVVAALEAATDASPTVELHWRDWRDYGPTEWDRLRRLSLAQPLGVHLRAESRLWRLLGRDVSDAGWATITDARADADMSRVRRNEEAPGITGIFGRLPARTDVQAIQRAAWAFLREPERAVRWSGGGVGLRGGTPAHDAPVEIAVEATHAAFADWLAHARSDPGFAHVTLDRRHVDTTTVALVATATSHVRVDGRAVTMRVYADLGAPPKEGAHVAPRQLAPLAGEPWEWYDTDRHGTRPDAHSSGIARAVGPPAATGTDAGALLGADRCDHPGAEWRVIDTNLPRYARLTCPQCLRTRIAVMPLHQLDLDRVVVDQTTHTKDNLQTIRSSGRGWAHFTDRYAQVAAYYDLLSGGDGRLFSYDALARRDGRVPMRPAHYACGPLSAPSRHRRSAEALLAGRRTVAG